jgi:hypothetical protein
LQEGLEGGGLGEEGEPVRAGEGGYGIAWPGGEGSALEEGREEFWWSGREFLESLAAVAVVLPVAEGSIGEREECESEQGEEYVPADGLGLPGDWRRIVEVVELGEVCWWR